MDLLFWVLVAIVATMSPLSTASQSSEVPEIVPSA
jgi:hypothetical protein